jgi:hypothetical protein
MDGRSTASVVEGVELVVREYLERKDGVRLMQLS